eukprot:8798818-Lingulodinium_polyedra.AAC.1
MWSIAVLVRARAPRRQPARDSLPSDSLPSASEGRRFFTPRNAEMTLRNAETEKANGPIWFDFVRERAGN